MIGSPADWFQSLPLQVQVNGNEMHVNGSLVFVADDRLTHPKDKTKSARMHNRILQESSEKSGRTMFFFRVEEWEIAPDVIVHWASHKMGLGLNNVTARQCTCERVESSDAKLFYGAYHLQGYAGGEHFGLKRDGEVVSVMTFSKTSQSRKGSHGDKEYTLARFALSGKVAGAASRLFKYAVRETGAQTVFTFSDNTYATGGVYEKMGFVFDGDVGPDYRVYHPSTGILHKSLWQRRSIPRRIIDVGSSERFHPDKDPRSESEMEELLGCGYVWDCGKKRWAWRA